jgi:aryl-alcohol dehydrogenase-like predicted oxidoreductase
MRECESSLRRLRTDWIDLYQCHWPDPNTPIRETMRALTRLLEDGTIRAIGLSNFGCEKMTAAREFGPIHALQPPFSMLQTRAREDLIPYCQEHGIAVLPYSPLAKGLLTGKFSENDKFSDIRARDPDFIGDRFRRNLGLVDGLRGVAERCGKTVAQVVVNWTSNQPGVTAPLLGAKRPTQIDETIGGVGWQLPASEFDCIDKLIRGAGDVS